MSHLPHEPTYETKRNVKLKLWMIEEVGTGPESEHLESGVGLFVLA